MDRCEKRSPPGVNIRPLTFHYDLTQSVQNSLVKQYADDTPRSLLAKDVNTLRKGLEEDADNVMKRAETNGLKLNTKKTRRHNSYFLEGKKRRGSRLK